MSFAHLHTHSHASAFDGLGRHVEFARRAAALGQPAIAFTEHGSVRGLYEAHLACAEVGLRLVPGVEAYLVEDAERRGLAEAERAALKDRPEALKRAEQERRERSHLTLWALDDEGLRNLYRLTTWSWAQGFYYKPRVDLARLRLYGAGLAASTGCAGDGHVVVPLARGDYREALDRLEDLLALFPGRLYVEVMPHVPAGREAVLPALLRLAERFDLPLLATQDAHYPEAADAYAHEVLLCIQTRGKMADPDRFRFDGREYWLRSREEMAAAFRARGLPGPAVERALDETLALADRCAARVQTAEAGRYLIAPELPAGIPTYDAWLLRLCHEGMRVRGLTGAGAAYLDRLAHELEVLWEHRFAPYFLAVWDVVRWAREQDIRVGPGRGSAAGSLVAYLLGITQLDPLRHDLMFERFIAPGRRDLPDIDLDFQADRREEVLEYLRRRYGEDRVAAISTQITFGGRRALRDLGRVFAVPDRELTPAASLLPLVPDPGDERTLAEVLGESAVGAAFVAAHPEVAEVAGRLEGQIRDVGLHAAGVVLSSVPVAEVVPLESRPRRGGARVPAVAYDMRAAEAAGLVKIDVLGLRTLVVLAEAARAAGVDPDRIDCDDPAALGIFAGGRLAGIFQFDTPTARRLCRAAASRISFEVLVALNALNRPGPLAAGLADAYVRRLVEGDAPPALHPVYDRIMAATLGVPVYQEQVVALARDLAGYSPEDADGLRKMIAKKLPGLAAEAPRFVAGATAAGLAEDEAADLFRRLVGFGRYAFNRSHAAAYAYLAVQLAFLKAHHPVAFYAAALAAEPDDRVQMRLAGEARAAGTRVSPPDVNRSRERGFGGGEGEIVGALSALKGIGPAAAAAVVAAAPFRDLLDFYRRTAGAGCRAVTARTFGVLAQATALRSLCPTGGPFLAANAAAVWARLRAGEQPELRPEAAPAWREGEQAATVSAVWPLFVDLAGQGALEGAAARLRCLWGPTHDPADPALVEAGTYLVAGYLAACKRFDADGSARLALAATTGEELSLRADADVAERAGGALDKVGGVVLALVHRTERGALSAEALWAEAACKSDLLFRFFREPWRTRPLDPAAALRRAGEGQAFGVEGVLVRVRQHTDRSGAAMRTLGIAGARGYLRVLAFASRMGADVRALRAGDLVSLRLRRLDGGAAALTDAPARKGPGAFKGRAVGGHDGAYER